MVLEAVQEEMLPIIEVAAVVLLQVVMVVYLLEMAAVE
jgi:hypothetical protein